jgi:hypothetical protein
MNILMKELIGLPIIGWVAFAIVLSTFVIIVFDLPRSKK